MGAIRVERLRYKSDVSRTAEQRPHLAVERVSDCGVVPTHGLVSGPPKNRAGMEHVEARTELSELPLSAPDVILGVGHHLAYRLSLRVHLDPGPVAEAGPWTCLQKRHLLLKRRRAEDEVVGRHYRQI